MKSEAVACVLAAVFAAVFVLSLGCDSGSHNRLAPDESSRVAEGPDRPPHSVTDHAGAARRQFQAGDFESAAESAYKALVQDPGNSDATLIASEAEAARGNHQTAADLAGSIDVRSRLGKKAVDVHAGQLLALNRLSEAADVFLAAIDLLPARDRSTLPWRHQAWNLLTRVGRRGEASKQADFICRAGQASLPELLSLLRRNGSYPFLLTKEKPEKYFQGGLGMARWYFTQGEHQLALDELSQEQEADFPTPGARALYGRLLAETQAYERMPAWYANCGKQIGEHSVYWSAVGTFLFDEHHFEASARALLECFFRDPSDDFTAHRLAKVFDALGRPEDAEQFRHRAVLLAQTQEIADRLIDSPAALETRNELTQNVLELGRVFETLQWTLTMLPAGAVDRRRAIEFKRAELSRDESVIRMAAESSLFGIDPSQFRLEPAMETVLKKVAAKGTSLAPLIEQIAVPRLVNVAGDVGLEFQWYPGREIDLSLIAIHEMIGGGIGVIDYDLDGWPDVYLAQGSGDPPTNACTRSSVLFRNLNARFETVTPTAQVEDFNFSSGVAVGDINQDGFPDLYLGSLGHNRLMINNGDGTFRDATSSLGDVADLFTSSMAIADINGDGLPDLFEAIYIEMKDAFNLPDVGPDGKLIQPTPLSHFPESDRWFENQGDGSFRVREISEDNARPGTSLGLIVTDIDSNGGNEIFVSNDARPNHFLVRASDGQLYNAADIKGIASGFSGESNGCMGIAPGDFNRDGTLDFHVTNYLLESSNHYLQTASGEFTDFAVRYGIVRRSTPFIGFGAKAVDVDRNGWIDLIVANGHVFDKRDVGESFQMPPQLLINRGSRFEQVSVDDDSGYWDNGYLGRSIANIDFDRDGAIDFLMGHLDQPLALLHNQTRTAGNWIQFELVGTSCERDAIGARVVLTMGDQRQTGWRIAGDGYLCSDEAVIDFGLGAHRHVDRVDIHWPSGQHQVIDDLQAGHRYLVVQGDTPIQRSNKSTPEPRTDSRDGS